MEDGKVETLSASCDSPWGHLTGWDCEVGIRVEDILPTNSPGARHTHKARG